MSSPIRFGKYWLQNLTEASKVKKMILAYMIVGASVVAYFLKANGYSVPSFLGSTFATWAELAAMVWGGVYLFLWKPFVRHEEVTKHCDTLRAEQTKRMVSVSAPEGQYISSPDPEISTIREPLVIKVKNTGSLTLRNLRVKVVKLNNPAALTETWGVTLPCVLSRHSPDISDLNPGDSFPYVLFAQVSVQERFGKKRVLAQLSAQGCLAYFDPERDYPITIQVTADDMLAFEQEFLVKFSSDRSYCEFILLPARDVSVSRPAPALPS